jgi:hypothetical protein
MLLVSLPCSSRRTPPSLLRRSQLESVLMQRVVSWWGQEGGPPTLCSTLAQLLAPSPPLIIRPLHQFRPLPRFRFQPLPLPLPLLQSFHLRSPRFCLQPMPLFKAALPTLSLATPTVIAARINVEGIVVFARKEDTMDR